LFVWWGGASFRLLETENRLVSSANRIGVKTPVLVIRSLMYKIKRDGTKMEPGGTPQVIWYGSETVFPSCYDWLRSIAEVAFEPFHCLY